jgi:hypothetical protein
MADLPRSIEDFATSEFKPRLDYVIGITTWMREYLGGIDDVATSSALDGLAHVKKARRTLNALERLFEEAAIAGMLNDGATQVAGKGYEAVLHSGDSRKEWRSQDLAGALVNTLSGFQRRRHPDIDASKVDAIVTETAWNLLTAGRMEWRTSKLPRYGIDPNDYCKREPGMATIEIKGDATYDKFDPDQEQSTQEDS